MTSQCQIRRYRGQIRRNRGQIRWNRGQNEITEVKSVTEIRHNRINIIRFDLPSDIDSCDWGQACSSGRYSTSEVGKSFLLVGVTIQHRGCIDGATFTFDFVKCSHT